MPKGDRRPPASPELIKGYQAAADLARRRTERVMVIGDVVEARAWMKIAQYCVDMVLFKAVDDDQLAAQRAKQRNAKVIPMSNEQMDAAQGLFVIGDSEGRELSPERETILELALGYLSPTQRVVYQLIVGGILAAEDVAVALDMDPREIRQHLARAKSKMRTTVRPKLKRLENEK